MKPPLYARAGIREVWIVDLQSESIERHTDPLDGGYDSLERARRGKTIEPAAMPELAIRVDAVLG